MTPDPKESQIEELEVDNDPNGGPIEELDLDLEEVLDAWLPKR